MMKKALIESLLREDASLKGAFLAVAHAYMDFSQKETNLWKVHFESTTHNDLPAWYKSKIKEALETIEGILMECFEEPKEKIHRIIVMFWAVVQGLSSICINKKNYVIENEISDEFKDQYLRSCIEGII